MIKILKSVYNGFSQHNLMTLAAALAFYTALALAPLLLISLSVVGLLAPGTQDELILQMQNLVGDQAAQAIQSIIAQTEKEPEYTSLSGILGAVMLLFSASLVFAQLQSSLNVIFEASPENVKGGVIGWILKRLLSMGMVLALAFIGLVSLLLNTAIEMLLPQSAEWTWVATGATFVVFSLLFALIYKYMPDVDLSWGQAFVGGVITSLLFAVGKHFISLYLGQSAIGSAYGAAGSLIVLLVWVYYSSVIVFLGAEFTRASVLNRKIGMS